MSTGWTYVGDGVRYSYGVPARDLSAEEFAALTPLDQRVVMQSGAYAPAAPAKSPKEMTREELNVYAAERGIADPESFGSKGDLLAALSGEGS